MKQVSLSGQDTSSVFKLTKLADPVPAVDCPPCPPAAPSTDSVMLDIILLYEQTPKLHSGYYWYPKVVINGFIADADLAAISLTADITPCPTTPTVTQGQIDAAVAAGAILIDDSYRAPLNINMPFFALMFWNLPDFSNRYLTLTLTATNPNTSQVITKEYSMRLNGTEAAF
jgi:hypothetical protein